MLETDPIQSAQHTLQAAVGSVLRGADPNLLRGPYCALLRATGQGKYAKLVEQLPPVPFVKMVKK